MNFGGILKTALPWIGAAVTGGPAGLATMGLKTLNDKLGTKAKNAEEAEAAYLNASPADRLAMKTEDDNFALQCQAMGIKEHTDIAKIDADDRASARNREIAIKDSTPRVLAYIYAGGFFVTLTAHIWFLVYIVLHHIVIDAVLMTLVLTPVSTLEGVLIGMVLGSKEYFFGSSAGSAEKSKQIAEMAK